MIRVNNLTSNKEVEIFIKLEKMNPGGSVKDRIAKYMIEDAERRGLLVPGAQGGDQPFAQEVGLDAHAVQQLDGCLLGLPQQSQEQVPALDAFGTELARLVAGEKHHAARFLSELFEHGSPRGKGPAPAPYGGRGRIIQGILIRL